MAVRACIPDGSRLLEMTRYQPYLLPPCLERLFPAYVYLVYTYTRPFNFLSSRGLKLFLFPSSITLDYYSLPFFAHRLIKLVVVVVGLRQKRCGGVEKKKNSSPWTFLGDAIICIFTIIISDSVFFSFSFFFFRQITLIS